MRAILVGTGGIGRAVLERLGGHWEVMAVDLRADRLEGVADPPRVQTTLGDGSSRITLERAGLADADAVVVAIRDDDVALEVCRLARDASVSRVVAMVVSAARTTEFTKLGVTAVSPDRLAARRVELTLEPRRVESAAFADGQAEAIEFRLAPDSPLVGRSLMELSLHGWLIAAVLRDGELIVPHGGTRLVAGDRVTIVGPATDHAAMVRVFTAGELRFPLTYGRRVGVALPASSPGILDEAIRFTRMTASDALVIVHPRLASLDHEAAEALSERIEALRAATPHLEFVEGKRERVGLSDVLAIRAAEHLGCLVLPRPRGIRGALGSLRTVAATGLPTLLASAASTWDRLVVPARDSEGGWESAWVALDLAGHASLPIEALGASSPTFLTSEDDTPAIDAAIVRLRDEGSVRGVEVTGRTVRENPVRLFRAVDPAGLLVLALGDPGNLFRPGFTAMVLSGLEGSMLVVPTNRHGE